MIRFYFIRHGETLYNLEEKVQGWNNSPLTELGKYQAKCTGYGLRDTVFVRAFSGDAQRQIDTASIVMQENGHPCQIISDFHFREMRYGKYEGGTFIDMLMPLYDSLKEEYKSYNGLYKLYNDYQIAEELKKRDETGTFEGLDATFGRIFSGLTEICKQYKDGNILISTSAIAIASVVTNLFPEIPQPGLVENASITIISYDGEYRLLEYSSIAYRQNGEQHYSFPS